MAKTATHQTKNTTVRVSHVDGAEVVLQLREQISDRRDKLTWISVPKAEIPGLLAELASVLDRELTLVADRERPVAVANGARRSAAVRLVSDNAAMPAY